MSNDLGRFTIGNLRRLLAVSAIVLLGLASFASTELKNLKLTYELTGFLAKADKAIEQDEELKKRYRLSSDTTIIVVAHRDEGWLQPTALETLSKISSQLASTQNVKSVMSLATLETVHIESSSAGRGPTSDEPELRIGKMTEYFGADDWKTLAAKSSLASPLLISHDGKLASVLVSVESTGAASKVAAAVNETLQHATRTGTISRYEMTGVSLLQSEMSDVLNREFSTLGGFGILVAAASLVVLFSGITGFFIAILTASLANVLVLGGLSHLGIGIGILSLSLPIVIAVQTLSLTVHILFTYLELRKEQVKEQAILTSFVRLFFPNLVVSIATGLGFLVLVASPVEAMKEFGWTVAVSSLVLWITTTAVAFGMLMIGPEPRLRRFVSGHARWILLFTRNAKPTLAIFAVLILGSLLTGMQLNYGHRLFDLHTSSAAPVRIVDQQLGGMIPVEIELRPTTTSEPQETSAEEAWTDETRLHELTSALGEIRKIPAVAMAYGVPDILGLAPAIKTGELLALLEMSSKNPLRHFLRDDGGSTRIQIRLRDVSSAESEAAIEKSLAALRSATGLQTSQITVAGWGAYIHRMNQSLAKSLMVGFWEALAAISFVLAIAFRSVRWAVAAIIPSVLPPLVLVAGLSVSGFSVKPGLAVVFTIALGFAFINSIYLLKRLKSMFEAQEKASTQASPELRYARWRKLVEKSFWQESQSCLLASLVLITGFVSLCFSEFEVSRSFGIAMVLSMILGMIGDLVLLPAMLYQFPQFLLGGPVKRDMKLFKDPAAALAGTLLPNPSRSRVVMALVTSGAAIATALFGLPSAASVDSTKLSLEGFAKEVAKRLYPSDKKLARDESVEIELTNIEPDGETETRKVEVSRLTITKGASGESRILAKVLSPKTLRGTSVLTVTDGEKQNRWVYLPASKNVRRLSGGDEAHAPILGSELSTEDLDLGQIDGATSKIVGRENGLVRIESKIRSKESAYSSCTAVFDEKTFLLKTADCLDRKGQPAKRIKVLDYRVLKGKVARPTEMEITNLKTKRISRVKFSEQRIGMGLSAGQFTPEALRD